MNRIFFVILLGVLGLVPERSLSQGWERDWLDKEMGHMFGQPGGTSNGRSGKPKKKQKTKATKQEVYAVIQVGEKIKVVLGTQVASEKKKAVEDYKQDLKDFQDSMKEAGKNKVDISKPVQKQVKVLKTSCKNKGEANSFAQKFLQEKTEQNQNDPKPKKMPDW